MLPTVLFDLIAQYVGDDIDMVFDFKDTLYQRYKDVMDTCLLVSNSSIPMSLVFSGKTFSSVVPKYIIDGKLSLDQVFEYKLDDCSHLFGWCQEVIDAFIDQEERRVPGMLDRLKDSIRWRDKDYYITYRGLKIKIVWQAICKRGKLSVLLLNRFNHMLTNDIWSNPTIPLEYVEARSNICAAWSHLALNKGIPLWFFVKYSNNFVFNQCGIKIYFNPALPLSFYAAQPFIRWSLLAQHPNATGEFFEQHNQLTPFNVNLLNRNKSIPQSFWDSRPHIVQHCILHHRWYKLKNTKLSVSVPGSMLHELRQLEFLDSSLWTTKDQFDEKKWLNLVDNRRKLPEILEAILQSPADNQNTRTSLLNSIAANKLIPRIYRERQVASALRKMLS